MNLRRPIVLLALLTSILPATAFAQCDADNKYMATVRAQAIVTGVIFANDGYELVNVLCGTLREGEEGSYTSTISPGSLIGYVAVCDEDCSDIDLRMYEDGRLVAEDPNPDDWPIIRYQARQGGNNYRIVASMYACSTEPCYYAIAMFEK
jgi:hypothetical protein